MPKVIARVLQSNIDEKGKMFAYIQLNGKLPKAGENITVKWGSTRSLSQNAIYWVFLTWCIENGLYEHGHFSPQALHEDLKAYFLDKKIYTSGEFRTIGESTTTLLNKVEFSDYFDKVDKFMLEFFNLDTTPFWKDYKDNYEV